MCGIAGIWSHGPARRHDAVAMADAIRHRGPDDGGIWHDDMAGIALSHRRLSIIDLTAAGHQPMASPCGRYILSFNGEIYNHRNLRHLLEAKRPIDWAGQSDTETLVHAIAHWGLAATLTRSVGMFALALWDRHERTLALARDRIGEKPLYFGWSNRAILFGSELKAIRAATSFTARTDADALALYLRHNSVPAPWSILQRVYKVEPGVIVTLDSRALDCPPAAPPSASGTATQGVRCTRYWSLEDSVTAGPDPAMTAPQAVEQLEARLRTAIAGQMIADVPVGAFLSGGIDSSTIVALMREATSARVRTFTIGFAEAGYDEAPHARAVARHLGTEHHETMVGAEDVRAVIPALPTIYDEPFADSSQLPTVLLSRITRATVTVALSGDGGDELFCGYNRYLVSRRVWDRIARLPQPLRAAIGRGITTIAPSNWDRLARLPMLPDMPMLGDKLHKTARMLGTGLDTQAIYRASSEEWMSGLPLAEPGDAHPMLALPQTARTPEERMMHWDMLGYLPNDILTKVDRASMAVGLETRVPFLDHHVVEQAWRTPLAFKKRDGQGKWLLRQILYRHVPPALIDRPKAGFAVPIGAWLRGPLRDWAEELLRHDQLRLDPLLDPDPIRRRWEAHVEGSQDWTASLWGVLMYRAWAAHWSEPC
ncbi:asparagine synthase (glutamine-hydrolyzing) [Sphingomonas sp. S1-29]|uniref:asparagine synthase (glutamine-hydrolyzing) n=1 Tax=Sphingomonas sp. S1-29 TaxID=2991074 RepID=UPI00223E99FE|nr:asparagine synthase (glutamine-hydrolyzing) [Sphingomonas sp. S1-29]UZK69011.1 asparagine synthase (glutamine-hydrolyzing) [Sphingomonas sp. S1-29]